MSQHNTIAAQAQRDSLRRLTDNSFYVSVSFEEALLEEESSQRVTVRIQCRELPLETLLFVISDLLYRLGDHAIKKSGEMIAGKLQEFIDAENDKEKEREVLGQLVGSIIPTLLEILPHTPELIARILGDVIIGATPEEVSRIGVSPSLSILHGVLTRLEAQEVREQFVGFFATLWSKFRRK